MSLEASFQMIERWPSSSLSYSRSERFAGTGNARSENPPGDAARVSDTRLREGSHAGVRRVWLCAPLLRPERHHRIHAPRLP